MAGVSVLEEIVEVVDFRGQCHQNPGHCGCDCLELAKVLLVISLRMALYCG